MFCFLAHVVHGDVFYPCRIARELKDLLDMLFNLLSI